MSKLSFYMYELLIDDKTPDISLFANKLKGLEETSYKIKDDAYTCNFIIRHNYPWFYFKYGSPYPCPKNLVNIDDFSITDNTRTIDQVEQNKQLFALYVPEKGVMYISNRRKISTIEHFLKEVLQIGNDISLRFIIKSEDDLIDIFNSITELRFTARSENLFKEPGLFDEAHNCYCLGAVNQLKITARFEPLTITQNVLRKFRKLVNLHRDGSINNLICVGKDNSEQKMEAMFNMNSILEKIEINVQENKETKMIESVSTLTTLLKKLGINMEE